MKRLTLEEENERLELYRSGLTDDEIGERLLLAREVVCQWRHSRGLPAHKRRNTIVPECVATLREKMYFDSKTDEEISVATGMTKSGVQSWRRRNGLPANRK